MKEDIVNIEILEDGTIRSTTPRISAANHSNSHQFFQFLARLTGGAVEVKKRGKEQHVHASEHQHQHGGH